MKTIIEPFKIKVVEPIRMTTRKEREHILEKAHFNPFFIHSKDVIIDLLTDSGTAAMSSKQWGGVMQGDEAYACSESFYHFERVVKELTSYHYIIPTHQGRAAERILFHVAIRNLGAEQAVVPSNTHFDTTRANIEYVGAKAIDLPTEEGKIPSLRKPFKGNMDIEKLENVIQEQGAKKIPLIMITITNNSNGGQPVSMENLKAVRKIADHTQIPFFLDAARFAENAYFIKLREPGYEHKSVKEIAQEMFQLSDGCTMSAKKDGLANMGGFLGLNNRAWAQKARSLLILTEGFPTYGGLSGRDLEALAQGFKEVLEEDYLRYRIRSIEYFGEKLLAMGIPIVEPPGGHAIYIDAKAFLPHIPSAEFPGQALVNELYLVAGIRAVEIGSVMFGKNATMELVRLAFPRRVYTQSHVDYMLECMEEIVKNKKHLRGFRITQEEPYLRHFTAHFERL
ncbi:MAG: tyrosine phenol-lyase [Deltaproteobacteria bacterium GWA2_38_16]|nr:MAG: tyrosine phenol-lyase [Deltaproteobacteria bacterium GWA2_38_16]OGQ03755.1 MAG: tyrosine phenol-lyase [Deltaproteobacteria bacterium RIFCSPHIGHO2_02_FULL_38_15]OGQ59003.1 MAG: tyrosine phenol-lyase [Deltaproteobacteria bacterium RIFCSPLOWO2_12_FULL_38_8]HBQ21317.1 tyrosine phenol-lyase [Deltaproteobacteria bacterium]